MIEVDSESEQFSRFEFEISDQTIHQYQQGLPDKVILSWYRPDQVIRQHQNCQFVVRLKQVWGYSNPGSLDHERAMFLKGIGAKGYVRSGKCEQSVTESQPQSGLREAWLSRFRAVSAGYQNSNWMLALTYGYRDDIQQEQWQVLRETGTSHLLAISGLHLSAISVAMFFVVGRLARCHAGLCERIPAQSIAAMAAMMVAIFYAYLAGFSLPTQRALIMVMVGLLAILFRKPLLNVPILSVALILTLIINPLSVLNAGFWLSFLAVLFIYIVLQGTQHISKWLRMLAVQFYLGLALFPVSLFFFSQASIISPFVNLFAIPWVSFVILPLLSLAQVFFLLDVTGSEVLSGLSDQLLELLWTGLQQAALFDYASLQFSPKLLGVIAYEIGLFILIQARGVPARHIAWVFIAALFFIRESTLTSGQMRFTVLDVGQGLSIVVEKTQHLVLVYDAGARFPSGYNLGKAVVLPFLKQQSIHHVDLVIASHNDIDHSGGIQPLMDEVIVAKLMISNRPELYLHDSIQLCRAGQHWRWDNVLFEIIHPPEKWQSNDNN